MASTANGTLKLVEGFVLTVIFGSNFAIWCYLCFRRPRRTGLGEEPRLWDVPCYPLRPRREFRLERLEFSPGEDNGRDFDYAVTNENRAMWREFFVSCVHSINPFVLVHIWLLIIQPLSADEVLDAVPSPRVNGGHSTQCAPTQIRISAIILMPTSRPSTPSTPSSSNTGGNVNQCINSQIEYTLGTSYLSYTPRR